ncbi:MAG: hypothetical protein GYB55_24935 [Cytophagales bacterium]|uniref:spondin domain-containing protein n=1 Tax=Cyclobacterium marinum TaxID=104 RepID=UPI0030D95391|nr:hypothetical protein [Cytophagales bacterium]|tara:strand:- start:626 stop:1873 length:1248 start_codon:yes stop_codon:yes gene_type:complete
MKNVRLFSFSAIIASLVMLNGCDTKEDEMPETMSSEFTVTIENIFEAKDFFNTGTTGLITPGNSETFSFNAGIGHSLSFATMLVESNDLFYSPDENGIPLYDEDGNPVTGDVSTMISLWDAGTEINEAPGTGPNQPMRQSEMNTGPSENNPVNIVNDAFNYPSTQESIKVEIAHDGGTMFTISITNTSENTELPSPFAPGVWVIHNLDQMPIFSINEIAGIGLEPLAEDGDNSILNTEVMSNTGFFSPLAPGAFSIGTDNTIFMNGQSAGAALESLAEDGDASGFDNVFNTPIGMTSPGPLLPGSAYSFTFTAEKGDKLSFASMLVESNDWVIGTDKLELFSNGMAISGEITGDVYLYDAGTEEDEYAGAGNNQPLRQSEPNTGIDEEGIVSMEANPSDNIPSITEMVKVTISPM